MQTVTYWGDIGFLRLGSDRQQDAYYALIELDIFSVLAEYDPILVGAFALHLETSDSSIEILCHVPEKEPFVELVQAVYGWYDDFEVQPVMKQGIPGVLVSFRYHDFTVEITGDPRPVEEQNAYQLMVAEGRLLQVAGDSARREIRKLILRGMMTEPAFGKYFALEGDVFDALTELADASIEELEMVAVRANWIRGDSWGEPIGPEDQ